VPFFLAVYRNEFGRYLYRTAVRATRRASFYFWNFSNCGLIPGIFTLCRARSRPMSAGSSRVLLTPPLRTESRVVLPRRARATAPCRQATTAGGARRRHRRTTSRSTRRGRWISLSTSCSESQVRQLHFLSTFYIEMIILPRHAPDKHRETTQKSACFPCQALRRTRCVALHAVRTAHLFRDAI
jgi:hypothetical protein